ncbi:MAG: DUF2225 domain-containing protein [Bacteroidia bacterium]
MKKVLILIFTFCVCQQTLWARSARVDSLFAIWNNKQLEPRARIMAIWDVGPISLLELSQDSTLLLIQESKLIIKQNSLTDLADIPYKFYGNYYRDKGEYNKALNSADSAIHILHNQGITKRLGHVHTNKGIVYRQMGFTSKALSNFKLALKYFRLNNEQLKIGDCLINIGVLYSDVGKTEKSLEYSQKALEIYHEIEDKVGAIFVYHANGSDYSTLNNYKKAFFSYTKALELSKETEYYELIPVIYGGLSDVYFKQSDYENGLKYGLKSIEHAKQSPPFEYSSSFYQFGNQLLDFKDYKKAIFYCNRSLEVADSIGAEAEAQNACHCLYKAYKEINLNEKALHYLDRYVELLEIINKNEAAKGMEHFEFEKEQLADSLNYAGKLVSLQLAHTIENAEKERSRNIAIGLGLFILIAAIGILNRSRLISRSKRALEHEKVALEKEKQRSDDLLLNILPAEVAEELKESGASEAQHFEQVNILFTDFKDFTQMAEMLSAKELVNEINTCFKAFDRICEKYAIEKIKTIGDSYMAASGLKSDNHGPKSASDLRLETRDIVLAALEMQQFIKARSLQLEANGSQSFQMRAGIHTGPVVAGIVGVKKFQYDIWGDTVNTASRMESHSEVGKMNISETTYEIIKQIPEFNFVQRDELEVKGKGVMKTFFVKMAS